MSKIAIVTGANKGIGHGIVETLYKSLDSKEWTIFLTARNEELGHKAVHEFAQHDIHVKFHQLDINDIESIRKLSSFIGGNYKGINILVNNAGIAFTMDSTAPFAEQAEVTLRTNFWATLNVCRELFPLLANGARVVNVSSFVSLMTLAKLGATLYKKSTSPMTMPELEEMMKDFERHTKAGDFAAHGWPETAYGVSKLGVTLMTLIQAQELANDPRKIVINCCCPGYVDTDMTRHKGVKTILDGADTPCYLATLPDGHDVPYGKFVSEREVKEWK